MIFGWRKELCVLEKTKPRSTIWKMNFKLEIDACIFKIKITVGIFRKSSYLLLLRLSNSYGSLSNSSSFTALCGFMEKKKHVKILQTRQIQEGFAYTCQDLLVAKNKISRSETLFCKGYCAYRADGWPEGCISGCVVTVILSWSNIMLLFKEVLPLSAVTLPAICARS